MSDSESTLFENPPISQVSSRRLSCISPFFVLTETILPQVLNKFVTLAYSQAEESERAKVEELCRTMISIIDTQPLPPPEDDESDAYYKGFYYR